MNREYYEQQLAEQECAHAERIEALEAHVATLEDIVRACAELRCAKQVSLGRDCAQRELPLAEWCGACQARRFLGHPAGAAPHLTQ